MVEEVRVDVNMWFFEIQKIMVHVGPMVFWEI